MVNPVVNPVPSSSSFAGSGKHGAAVFDGINSVTNCSRSGSVYTAAGDCHFTSMTMSSGVTLNMDGWRLLVRGILSVPSGTATVTASPVAVGGPNNGSNNCLTSSTTYGGGTGRSRSLGSAVCGANGGTGVGSVPPSDHENSLMCALSPGQNNSGAGGAGSSGAGGVSVNKNSSSWTFPNSQTNTDILNPLAFFDTACMGFTYYCDTANPWNYTWGPVFGGLGGSSGAGDGTNVGGAGGCGGNVCLVNVITITGTLNVTAPGGAGGTPTTGNCGGGGGGTGGVVIVNSLNLTAWTGSATATGGAAGLGVGTGTAGSAGGAGFVQTTQWA